MLDEALIGVDGAIRMTDGNGHPGTDPQPSGYHGGSFYNGGAYRYAIATPPTPRRWTAGGCTAR